MSEPQPSRTAAVRAGGNPLVGGMMRLARITNKPDNRTETYSSIYPYASRGGIREYQQEDSVVHPGPAQAASAHVAHGGLRRRQHPSRGRGAEHVAAGSLEAAEGS